MSIRHYHLISFFQDFGDDGVFKLYALSDNGSITKDKDDLSGIYGSPRELGRNSRYVTQHPARITWEGLPSESIKIDGLVHKLEKVEDSEFTSFIDGLLEK